MAKIGSSREAVVAAPKAATVELVGSEGPSFYTNNTSVETTLWDVRLRFAETLQIDREKNLIRAREVASVRMSPQHAKVVARLLTEQLAK